MLRRVIIPLCAATLFACGAPDPAPEHFGTDDAQLGDAIVRQRAAIIRDAARDAGVTNPVLIAGVAAHESGGLYFCHNEGLTSCPGPASPDCGGGPILAGYWDGPCSDQQGGLGFFQFDAGTYNQTLNTYGQGILTIDGNTKAGANLIIYKVRNSPHTPDFGPFKSPDTEGLANALDWLNSVVVDGNNYDSYLTVLAANYNGCTKGCTLENGCNCNHEQRKKDYDSGIKSMLALGADFWGESGGGSSGGGGNPGAPSSCGVEGDGKLHCDNKVDVAMYADPTTGSAVVNYLRTSPSWFDCWGTGDYHAGGNTTWYHTLGDDSANWGWVPAVDLKTPDSFDTNPSTQGLTKCGSAEPTPLPANCNVHADGKLYCDNVAGAAIYKTTSVSTTIVDYLDSSPSWFACWGMRKHSGGNNTWYFTQGDENGNWGWVPAVSLSTPSEFDADPGAWGFGQCD